MITPTELIERITAAADYHDCIVIVQYKTQANLRWASSTLTTNGVIAEQHVTVIAFVEVDGGLATGSLTFSDVDPSQYAAIAAAAADVARAAGKSDDAVELLTDTTYGDWHGAHQATGPEVFSSFAPALGESFRQSHADQIELFGYAEHTHQSTWVGSKGGLRLRHDQPSGRVEMTAKSHNRTRSTWEGRPTRDFTTISMADIDANIRQRLAWQERTSAFEPGRYTTVVPSGAMADLMAYILWTSSGRDAFEGRSVFAQKGAPGTTRVGELLASMPVNLFSDPTYPGLETSPFVVATESNQFTSVFDNGVSLPRFDLVNRGHLDSLITSRASSARTGLDFSPVGDNMITKLPGASGDLNSLVAGVDKGLLITTFWYIRTVDPTTYLLTGLTRDGVYEIRDGEVIGAVNNFRWNESPVDLLSRIAAVGATEVTATRELEEFQHTAAPAVVFRDFNMSTVSQAN